MFEEGEAPVREGARRGRPGQPEGKLLQGAIEAAGDPGRPPAARLAVLQDPALVAAIEAHPIRELLTIEGPYPAYADRAAGAVQQLVRVLPALGGRHPRPPTARWRTGTFQTAAKRLDAVAAMGFDVIYLPPIHPIGEVNRKGPNNTLTPGPDDPGSPWAIGSKDGGHDAIHPDLGTIEDFDAFVERARDLGLEVALDLALQCAPDHPWVTSHPEFFTTRSTARSPTPRTRRRSTRTSTR